MKNLKNQLFLFSGFLFLTNLNLLAQGCTNYFPLIKGNVYEMETFNSKDKKTGKMVYTVEEVNKTSGKTEASILSETFDEKDKSRSTSQTKVICEKDYILVDLKTTIPSSQTDAYKNMESKVEGNYMQIPSKLEVGQSLPDASMTITMIDKKSGSTYSKMTINIVNRKVESKESITTPAGTYDCFKIKYEGSMQTKLESMPINMPKFNYVVVEYLSPGIGMVKTISMNKNEKPLGYTQLSKFPK